MAKTQSIKAGNLKRGMYVFHQQKPYEVVKTSFINPGRGSAFMRVKLRSIQSGGMREETYKSSESVPTLEVESLKMQFLYADQQQAVFMKSNDFSQVEIDRSLVAELLDLLTPQVEAYVLIADGQVVGVNLPPKVTLAVKEALPAVAGNTVGQARKEVVLETGLKVQAPIFVKTGDSLVIDTETKTYVSRA